MDPEAGHSKSKIISLMANDRLPKRGLILVPMCLCTQSVFVGIDEWRKVGIWGRCARERLPQLVTHTVDMKEQGKLAHRIWV